MLNCPRLNGSQVAITPGFLKACGSATHAKGAPVIDTYKEPTIHRSLLTWGLKRIILENQTRDGPCVGCKYLTEQKPPFAFTNFLHTVSLHDFSGCNSNCVYCVGSEYTLPEPYKESLSHTTLFLNLLKSRLIRPSLTTVAWGGGEPTLLDSFGHTVLLLRSNRIWQVINTNGIVFSEAVAQALVARQASVRISVDSGTIEGFERVKRNPHCFQVWQNVERYVKTGGEFILKYIVFGLNSDRSEILAFVLKAREAGVKQICISVDAHTQYSHLKGQITEKELEGAALLYNMAKAYRLNPYFEPLWSPGMIRQIEHLGNFKRRRRLPQNLTRQLLLRLAR